VLKSVAIYQSRLVLPTDKVASAWDSMRSQLEEIIHNSSKLHSFLKEMIITSLKLEEISVEEIDDDAPLFKENFNVIIEDEDVGKEAFGSIRILAKFLQREYSETGKDTLIAAG
jgi:hypothetical protein